MIQYRFAGPDDAAVLHRFIVDLAIYEREPDAVEVDAATLAAQMRQERAPFECVLAEIDGESVGFALFFQNYSTWKGVPGMYLEDLFVPEALRGRGIGQGLLQHLAAIAVERGYARIDWAVLDWNEPSIRFYEHLGAQALSDWTTFRLTGPALERMARGPGPA